MKCPKCYADTFIILTTAPAAHLMGGKHTMWCETCGTTADTYFPDGSKLRNVKTPKAIKGDHTHEDSRHTGTKRRRP